MLTNFAQFTTLKMKKKNIYIYIYILRRNKEERETGCSYTGLTWFNLSGIHLQHKALNDYIFTVHLSICIIMYLLTGVYSKLTLN